MFDTTGVDTVVEDGFVDAGLEPGVQELESLEFAPDLPGHHESNLGDPRWVPARDDGITAQEGDRNGSEPASIPPD